ncbi:hypothetical protein [Pedobacter agri]|uniref:hypothetical protein n=1 Tax=Pedobacter agri TaxID=454586 RepID=UPI00292D4CC4|nr:hypothetical protein [Pedobacter agri]
MINWKIDIELDFINVANIKTYEVFRTTSNQFYQSRYEIRVRTGMLKATFNF